MKSINKKKKDKNSNNNNTLTSLFDKLISIGLSRKKTEKTLKDVSLSKILSSAFESLDKQKKNISGLPTGVGMLIYHLCTKIKTQALGHLNLLTSLVASKRLNSTIKIDCALEFVLKYHDDEAGCEVDVVKLNSYCVQKMLDDLQIGQFNIGDLDKMNKAQITNKFTLLFRRHKRVSHKYHNRYTH
jgi:hypothetical protein